MEGHKKIEVNGREYTITMLSPSQAFDFFYDLQAAQSRGESIARFNRMAIGQCHDSKLRALSDSANFSECFAEFPEDMLLLGSRAKDELILPFLPKEKDTGKNATD